METRARFSVVTCVALCLGVFTGRVADAQSTDAQGLIVGDNFLALGPFANAFGCGDQLSILGNHIANDHIACQYPEDGDEVDYDALASVSDSYKGPIPDPNPGVVAWRPFNDGSGLDGDQDLDADADPAIDVDDHMTWLVTYVEYTGVDPQLVQFCAGSDDGIQVWWDDEIVHSNNACRGRAFCQDQPAIIAEPGVHRIAVAAWERGGGWGLSIGMRVNGAAVVDLDGDGVDDGDGEWIFRGREGASEVAAAAACEAPDVVTAPARVTDLSCAVNPAGGLDVNWTNPIDVLGQIEIVLLGEGTVGMVDEDVTSFTVDAADLPEGKPTVCVVNGSGFPVCCSTRITDGNGFVTSDNWLVLGPFTNPFGCAALPQSNDSILGNHIVPGCIECEYPAEGDSIPNYDAVGSVSTSYIGPTDVDGDPMWRKFSDGSNDFDFNLEGDVTGAQDDVMSWMATYVRYTGVDPIDVQLCVGSDDGIQVWMNDQLVHNNNACRGRATCQDLAPVTIPGPGVYCFKVGIWERGGGWGGSLRLQDNLGTPIVDSSDFPEWEFLGANRPAEADDLVADCTCPTAPPNITRCERQPDGSVELEWEIPDNAGNGPTQILLDDLEIDTVPANETTYTLDAGDAEGGDKITIVTDGSIGASCNIAATEPDGLIRSEQWLVLGPFANTFGCNNDNQSLLGNHIAPSCIGCEFPQEGDTVDYDSLEAVTSSYDGPPDPADSLPYWRAFNDGSNDGDNNLDGDLGDRTDVMSWMITYVEYLGDLPIDVDLCIGSDDGVQVWIDRNLVHNNNACRAVGTCQDLVSTTIEPGPHRIAVGTWERAGGWAQRFAIQENFVGVVDGDPNWVFHGRSRPAGLGEGDCDCPLDPIRNLVCTASADGSVDLSWTNGSNSDAAKDIVVLVQGEEVDRLAGDAESATVSAADVGDDDVVTICVANDDGEGTPVSCTITTPFGIGAEVEVVADDFEDYGPGECPDGFNCQGVSFTPGVTDELGHAGRLRMAQQDVGNIASTMIWPEAIDLTEQSVEVTFTYYSANNARLDPADGLTVGFLDADVDTDTFIGGGGGGNGYLNASQKSWGVEFDTWNNGGEPSGFNGADNYTHVGFVNQGLVTPHVQTMVDFNPDLRPTTFGGTGWPVMMDTFFGVGNAIDCRLTYNNGLAEFFITADATDGQPAFDDEKVLSAFVGVLPPGGCSPARRKGPVASPLLANGLLFVSAGTGGSTGHYEIDDLAVTVFERDDLPPVGPIFRRGDTDGNGLIEVTDPINNLTFQFLGTVPPVGYLPPCLDAADFDDNGRLEITDPINNLFHQFLSGDPPPAPGKITCGVDPTLDDANLVPPPGEGPEDELGCLAYPNPDLDPAQVVDCDGN